MSKKYRQVDAVVLKKALRRASGNVTHAAEALDMSKMHIYRLAKKYDLQEFARDLRIATHGSATGKPPAKLHAQAF